MVRDTYIGFRAPEQLKERLKTLADKEDRTMSQMATILLEEALNERECAAVIRQADAGKAKMCSLHCQHLNKGLCHVGGYDGTVYLRGRLGHGWYASELCPYTAAHFERWQEVADAKQETAQELMARLERG